MSVDYLDLLLMRETRAAPLAEPRIETAPAASVPGPSGWGEIIEEREVPYFTPSASEGSRSDVEPHRAEARPQAPVNTAVFPPSIDRHEAQPVVSAPQPLTASTPARIAADDTTQESAAARHPVQTMESIDAPLKMAAPRTAFEAKAAPTDPRAARRDARLPEEPRVIATRPAPVPASLPHESPVAPPVTIRIDRVEVRAAPAATPPAPGSGRPQPRVSLDEFLKRRSGARRE